MGTEVITLEEVTTGTGLVPYDEINAPLAEVGETEENKKLIAEMRQGFDRSNRLSIVHFGSSAQDELTNLSRGILGATRNKDIGEAGEIMNEAMLTLRGFIDETPDDLSDNRSWLERQFGKLTPVAKFVQRFEQVKDQMSTFEGKLLQGEEKVERHVEFFSQSIDAAKRQYKMLQLYIAAAKQEVHEINTVDLKKLVTKLKKKKDNEELVREIRSLVAYRDDIERRISDMQVTKTATNQAIFKFEELTNLGSTAIMKSVDTRKNTIPMWIQNAATAMGMQEIEKLADTVALGRDVTNDLLKQGAKQHRQIAKKVGEINESTIISLDTLKEVNTQYLGMLEDAAKLREEGRRLRAETETACEEMEQTLRNHVVALAAEDVERAQNAA